MKPALVRCLILLSALLLSCALVSCESEPPKEAEEDTTVTEESAAPDTAGSETETDAPQDGAIPNLPEDGYTKLY